jgi:hypothetical protein
VPQRAGAELEAAEQWKTLAEAGVLGLAIDEQPAFPAAA